MCPGLYTIFWAAFLVAKLVCVDHTSPKLYVHTLSWTRDEQGHNRQDGSSMLIWIMVQITALGNPKLLERVAAGLMAIRNMFSQFDEDMNNVITREEFIKVTGFWSYAFVSEVTNAEYLALTILLPSCASLHAVRARSCVCVCECE